MTIASILRTTPGKSVIASSIALGLVLSLANSAFAGPREQAWRIYSRLTGTSPDNTMLATMTTCISEGNNLTSNCTNNLSSSAVTNINNTPLSISGATKGQIAAAYLAMQDPANPGFLNVKVKNMVIPWTNKDQTVFAPLNDTAATLIGIIRDGIDFRTALYDNIIYTGPGTYNPSSNSMYAQMEHQSLNLANPSVLVKGVQSTVTGLPQPAVAGVLTTRASARAFFYAGTNRAMFRFTMMNYLCNDLESLKDVTRTPDRVRQDVSRSPGGDSTIYLNNCVGCHAGMDGMAGAFAYYNWGPAIYNPNETPAQIEQESISYQQTPTLSYQLSGKQFDSMRVIPKYLHNFNSFPYGFVTKDDSWVNYWRTGPNAKLGWENNPSPQQPTHSDPSNSNGLGSAAQLGYELSHTTAFARCQVVKVYRQVCMNDPDETTVQNIVTDFTNTNNSFNMLTVFGDAAVDCSKNL